VRYLKSVLPVACFCAVLLEVQPCLAEKAGHNPLPNFDKRLHQAAPKQNTTASQEAALAELQRRDSTLRLEFDPISGSPRLISKPDGFLALAREKALQPRLLVAQDLSESARMAIRAFVDEHALLFGHGSKHFVALDSSEKQVPHCRWISVGRTLTVLA
jgi:hypothetical protein